MQTMKVALINNINYCRFPAGIHSIKDFIELLNRNYHSFLALEVLVEEGCVAPYYIEEELKTETQYWNPSNIRLVKESEVHILRRTEYLEKLAEVIRQKCTQCVHYSEAVCAEDYKSHIEHIGLDGECYGFEKKNEVSA